MGGCHLAIKVLPSPAEPGVLPEVLSVSHLCSSKVLLIKVVSGGCKASLLNPDAPGLRELCLESGPDVVLGVPGACPKG